VYDSVIRGGHSIVASIAGSSMTRSV